MWLLKFHVAFSILCLVTFIGFYVVCKETLIKNGYGTKNKKKKLYLYLLFFVPLMNVLYIVALFLMIGQKKEDLYELLNMEDRKNEN